MAIVNQDDDFALVKVKHESATAMTDALPVFSDKDAAEDFRDEHFPSWALEEVLDKESLVQPVTALREKGSLLAFDPYRIAIRPATIPLNVLREQTNGE